MIRPSPPRFLPRRPFVLLSAPASSRPPRSLAPHESGRPGEGARTAAYGALQADSTAFSSEALCGLGPRRRPAASLSALPE